MLTDRYLAGIPEDSRAASGSKFLTADQLTEEKLAKVRKLNDIAQARGQKLSQMALQWVLRDPAVTSALIGASRSSQIDDAIAAVQAPALDADTLTRIEQLLSA